jgi:imidazoleglycerol phosphate synthase glutamine amidotransferase subunit HisH
VEQKEYVVRVQSDVANTYGIGEVVVPGVALFKDSETHLTKDELNTKLKQLGKVTLR